MSLVFDIADDSPRTEPLIFYVVADEKRVKTVSDVWIAAPPAVDVPIEGVTCLAIVIESLITPNDKSGGECPGTERTGAWIDPLFASCRSIVGSNVCRLVA